MYSDQLLMTNSILPGPMQSFDIIDIVDHNISHIAKLQVSHILLFPTNELYVLVFKAFLKHILKSNLLK